MKKLQYLQDKSVKSAIYGQLIKIKFIKNKRKLRLLQLKRIIKCGAIKCHDNWIKIAHLMILNIITLDY